MFHRWAAPLLVLALCAMSPKTAEGQTSKAPPGQGAGKLGANYPNPFNPETFQPFSVTPDVCTDGSQQHVVTLRIMNIIGQQVAVFRLQGVNSTSTTTIPSSLVGAPLTNVHLGCGNYVGYWDMKKQDSNQDAASGPYMVQLFVDGQIAGSRRIYLKK